MHDAIESAAMRSWSRGSEKVARDVRMWMDDERRLPALALAAREMAGLSSGKKTSSELT